MAIVVVMIGIKDDVMHSISILGLFLFQKILTKIIGETHESEDRNQE